MKFGLKAALVAMGYRRMNEEPEIWGKPVGFSLYTVKEENGIPILFCHFRNCLKEMDLWNTKVITTEDTTENYLIQIATHETSGRLAIGEQEKPLSFHNTEELTGLML